MNVIPKIMPDELFTSYVSRTSTASGIRESRNSFRFLTSYINDPTQHCLRLTAKTKGTVPRPKLKPRYYNYSKSILKYCPICRQKDIERLGFTYFRRSHQSSIVLICPDHNSFLLPKNIENSPGNQGKSSDEDGLIIEKAALSMIASIVIMLHNENMTSFKTDRIFQHIRNFIYCPYDVSYHKFYDTIVDKLNSIPRSVLGQMLYAEKTRERGIIINMYSKFKTQEEMIVYYCLLSDTPSVDHFKSLIDHQIKG